MIDQDLKSKLLNGINVRRNVRRLPVGLILKFLD
jgi:hypothetical protein